MIPSGRQTFIPSGIQILRICEKYKFRRRKMATLKDVARETELTVSTVSRVLNNRGYISEETRNKVYAAMKKLNYQPNELARSLS